LQISSAMRPLPPSALVPSSDRAWLALPSVAVPVHVRSVQVVSADATVGLASIDVRGSRSTRLRVLGRRNRREVSRIDAPAVKAGASTGACSGSVVAQVIHLPMSDSPLGHEWAAHKLIGEPVRSRALRFARRQAVAETIDVPRPVPAAASQLPHVRHEPWWEFVHAGQATGGAGQFK
jgi:hypothetical protein